MTSAQKTAFADKEAELNKEPESQHLDQVVDQQSNTLASTNGEKVHQEVQMMNGESAAAG